MSHLCTILALKLIIIPSFFFRHRASPTDLLRHRGHGQRDRQQRLLAVSTRPDPDHREHPAQGSSPKSVASSVGPRPMQPHPAQAKPRRGSRTCSPTPLPPARATPGPKVPTEYTAMHASNTRGPRPPPGPGGGDPHGEGGGNGGATAPQWCWGLVLRVSASTRGPVLQQTMARFSALAQPTPTCLFPLLPLPLSPPVRRPANHPPPARGAAPGRG